VSSELSPGVHQVEVAVGDSAGNVSSASIEITVDADLVHTPPANPVAVEALFVSLTEGTDLPSTTSPTVGAAPSPPDGGVDLTWILAAAGTGAAVVIGGLWNGRRRRPTG
jgi:hypothetical protein